MNTPKIDRAVMCYCVHTPEIAGKFDMAAATKLGVPKGPLCGKLVKGETVELPNGKKV
jgi:ribonuclease Z